MELQEFFAEMPDLKIIWVMSDTQINERTRSFINEFGLADHVLFLSDPKSQLIRDLGVLKEDPEHIEIGVPHPTTILLDRNGFVRFIDLRENYHFWLSPEALKSPLAALEADS